MRGEEEEVGKLLGERVNENSQRNQLAARRSISNDRQIYAGYTEGRRRKNRAAMEYVVPRTTLKDRVAGRVQHGCESGDPLTLHTKKSI